MVYPGTRPVGALNFQHCKYTHNILTTKIFSFYFQEKNNKPGTLYIPGINQNSLICLSVILATIASTSHSKRLHVSNISGLRWAKYLR